MKMYSHKYCNYVIYSLIIDTLIVSLLFSTKPIVIFFFQQIVRSITNIIKLIEIRMLPTDNY